MASMLPIISISDLQRSPKSALASVKDFAVVQSHGEDRAFILHPRLGKILLESGMLEILKEKCPPQEKGSSSDADMKKELTGLIGNVLRELSKK
jgi:hypothetical protein